VGLLLSTHSTTDALTVMLLVVDVFRLICDTLDNSAQYSATR
jgi:hypothetical protein